MVKPLYLLSALVCAAWWGRGQCYVESPITRNVFNDYDANTPPSSEGSPSLRVTMTYYVGNIVDLDERTGRLETSGFLYFGWRDERLQFSSNHTGVSNLKVKRRRIWTPDIALYHAVSPGLQILNQPDMVLVSHDGAVIWAPQVSTFSMCYPSSDELPTSSFICTLKFGSWVYDANDMILNATSAQTWLRHYFLSSTWKITDTSLINQHETYDCCHGAYTTVSFTITLERRDGV